MNQPPLSTITINGLLITHTISGAGKPALLLHGWGANATLMWPLAQRLAPLGYRVHLPEMPGFGNSQTPSVAWSVFDYVKFVLAYLSENSLDQVYLFGHSFGGRLGLILGAEYRQRLVKMALANSAGVRSPALPGTQLRLKTYRLALQSLRAVGLKAQADWLRDWYSDRYGSADYKAVTGVMRETFVKVVNQDLLPYAAKVGVPTLLFWGDQDSDTPLWQGQLLEKTIPDAGLVVWEGAGHYSYLDRLADTVRVLDHFWSQ